MQDGYQSKVKGVFIAREVSRRYSNGCTFDSHAPTKMRRFENRASCVGYLDGQASSLAFQRKVQRDMMAMQQLTHVADLSICIEHIINLV
jgi:hypothetical protein